jgi:histidine triad (HIT) family protein
MMMTRCTFCNIISRELPSETIYADEQATAFRDINPVAPTHILIVPNKHLANVNDVTSYNEAVMGHLFTVARQLADQEGIADSGYRLIVNTGPDGGQVIYHLHMHLIGGRKMHFPMG